MPPTRSTKRSPARPSPIVSSEHPTPTRTPGPTPGLDPEEARKYDYYAREKSVSCVACGEGFGTVAHLLGHIIRKTEAKEKLHEGLLPKPEEEPHSFPSSKTRGLSRALQFICGHCQLSFTHMDECDDHFAAHPCTEKCRRPGDGSSFAHHCRSYIPNSSCPTSFTKCTYHSHQPKSVSRHQATKHGKYWMATGGRALKKVRGYGVDTSHISRMWKEKKPRPQLSTQPLHHSLSPLPSPPLPISPSYESSDDGHDYDYQLTFTLPASSSSFNPYNLSPFSPTPEADDYGIQFHNLNYAAFDASSLGPSTSYASSPLPSPLSDSFAYDQVSSPSYTVFDAAPSSSPYPSTSGYFEEYAQPSYLSSFQYPSSYSDLSASPTYYPSYGYSGMGMQQYVF